MGYVSSFSCPRGVTETMTPLAPGLPHAPAGNDIEAKEEVESSAIYDKSTGYSKKQYSFVADKIRRGKLKGFDALTTEWPRLTIHSGSRYKLFRSHEIWRKITKFIRRKPWH